MLAYLPPHDSHEPKLITALGRCSEPEPGVLAIDDDAVMALQLVRLLPDGSGKPEVEPNTITIGKGARGISALLGPWRVLRDREDGGMSDLRSIALALTGEVSGAPVAASGPGQGKRVRSLSIKASATSPDGFVRRVNEELAGC
jgi:hypothetical protein